MKELPKERALRTDNNNFFIQIKNLWGYELKNAIHNEAKKLEAYHKKIEWSAVGYDDDGNPIPIDSVGKWIFGVKGYAGHVIFDYQGHDICPGVFKDKVRISLPLETPGIVTEILIAAIKNLNFIAQIKMNNQVI
jgi:hypothetical protein